jgi:hypothetical protein
MPRMAGVRAALEPPVTFGRARSQSNACAPTNAPEIDHDTTRHDRILIVSLDVPVKLKIRFKFRDGWRWLGGDAQSRERWRTHRAENAAVDEVLKDFDLRKRAAVRGNPRSTAAVAMLRRCFGCRRRRPTVRDRACIVRRRGYAADEVTIARAWWRRRRRRRWCRGGSRRRCRCRGRGGRWGGLRGRGGCRGGRRCRSRGRRRWCRADWCLALQPGKESVDVERRRLSRDRLRSRRRAPSS